jgi:hypothetical protein
VSRVVQALLGKFYINLAVDGWIGPITRTAFYDAPPDLQSTIVHCTPMYLLNGSTSVASDLQEADMVQKQQLVKVVRAMQRVSLETGVPLNWLVTIAFIESSLNPKAINGQSRGLFQIQRAAWQDSSSKKSLPDYNKFWHDPYWNALAAATYIQLNIAQLRDKGLDAIDEPRWIYLAHQQGVTGLVYLERVSRGENQEQIVSDEAMRRNPAPGYDVTVEPRQFYLNWMDYLRSYF